ALDEDHERIVGDAFLLERVDHTTDVKVVIGKKGGVDFRHVREEFLVSGVERVPCRQVGWARGQDGILRNDAELLLPRESLLAQLVPALVELPFELGGPFLRDMMRGMRRPWRV